MSTTRTQPATAPQENAYEVVVGMEVHAQVLTRSKMFCGCAASYQGASPNSLVCPVCLGLPGAMPVINQRAVEATIATGLALNCQVADTAVLCPQKLYLPGPAKGIPDYPIRISPFL